MRLQLALNVENIDDAVAYYQKLFGVAPHKRRAGYANFAISEPPLKLVLFENAAASERLNHLGVEVESENEVEEALHRLDEAGIMAQVQNDTICCHARQDKIWTTAHDGISWEWYRVTDELTVIGEDADRQTCCTGETGTENMGGE